MSTPPSARLRYCAGCRRLQPLGDGPCIGCDRPAAELQPVEASLAAIAAAAGVRGGHVVRYPGDTRFVVRVGVGFSALLALAVGVAGEHLAGLLVMTLFASITGAAFVDASRAARVRRAVRRVPRSIVPDAGPRVALQVVTGIARPVDDRDGTLPRAPLADRACLALRLDLRTGAGAARLAATSAEAGADDGSGDLVAHWLDAVDMLVIAADGQRVLVTGRVCLDAVEYDLTEPSAEAVLELAGQPLEPAPLGEDGWACELAVMPGDAVEVTGRAGGELRTVAALAGYRDAGPVAVLRGEPGAPVVVRVARA
ncbi:hypothetical protein [Haliangium sp.]|uniref:hypothetical protein n=1 Tax=Haliangium sp. TaxID=2663208 RepID=UPI003D0D88BA